MEYEANDLPERIFMQMIDRRKVWPYSSLRGKWTWTCEQVRLVYWNEEKDGNLNKEMQLNALKSSHWSAYFDIFTRSFVKKNIIASKYVSYSK